MNIELKPWQRLNQRLVAIGRREGGKLFMGYKPDRWFEDVHYRCTGDHVSTSILRSEVNGDTCLECLAPAVITFPEDKDGPLQEPV